MEYNDDYYNNYYNTSDQDDTSYDANSNNPMDGIKIPQSYFDNMSYNERWFYNQTGLTWAEDDALSHCQVWKIEGLSEIRNNFIAEHNIEVSQNQYNYSNNRSLPTYNFPQPSKSTGSILDRVIRSIFQESVNKYE